MLIDLPEPAPWALENVWGHSPEGAEPPLPACWLPPPPIGFESIPALADGLDPGIATKTSAQIPGWVVVPEAWFDPIIGTDPNPTDPDAGEGGVIQDFPLDLPSPVPPAGVVTDLKVAPERELSVEPAPWVDPIRWEYWSFVENNPQWPEENGAGGIQLQVFTPSTFLPWISLGTPGEAMAFDRWYEQTYLKPVMSEPPEEAPSELNPPGGWDQPLFPSLWVGCQPLDSPAPPSPVEESSAPSNDSVSAPTQSGFEDAGITVDGPPIQQDLTDSTDDPPAVLLEALADPAATPGANQDLNDPIPALTPLPAQEGVTIQDEELLLAPLNLNLPDFKIWRPVRLATGLKTSDQR